MKRLTTILLLAISLNSFSQLGGPKWSESGNATTGSSFLGTTNSESLFFRTNNLMRFYISSSGDVVFPLLGSSSNGFAVLDNTGKVIKINFSGSSSDVFFGNGTFGSLSAATGWITSSGITFTNNKVGIGITSPSQALEVNGNIIANGSVNAQEFNVGDVVSQGKNLRISTNICLDGYDPSTGMRNELCVFTQPLFINSKTGLNFHTILNADNTGNVGVGTNTPIYKLDIAGSMRVSGESFYNGTSHFSRITKMPGDTVIRIGDSTFYIDDANNRIYFGTLTSGGPSGTSFWSPKGLAMGSVTATATGIEAVSMGRYASASGIQSIAIGSYSKSFAPNSVCIGSYVGTVSIPFSAGAEHSMVIGSGISPTQSLVNTKKNSLMIGFNSTIPTLFVGESSGAGTTGGVGIGTTDIPIGFKLAVNGKIITEEIVLLLKTDWPDFAFETSFKRKTYLEKEQYYIKHKHLENLLSAKEIQQNGMPVIKTMTGIVQNTEENSLDIIDLYKMFELMDKKITSLELENKQLKTELEKIKG